MRALFIILVLSVALAHHPRRRIYPINARRYSNCDLFENCIERDEYRPSYARRGNMPNKRILVRKFYSNEDPWNELFRSFIPLTDTSDEIYPLRKVYDSQLPRNVDDSHLSRQFDNIQYFQTHNLDRLDKLLNPSFLHSVKEGKWYRIKDLERKEFLDDNDSEDLFRPSRHLKPFSPSHHHKSFRPTPSTSTHSSGGLIAIGIIGVIAVVIVIAIVISTKMKKLQTTRPFINNRVVSKSGEESAPNYGTFSS